MLSGLFKELGVNVVEPALLYSDSKVAIQIAAHPIFHERTKLFDIDCHFVRGENQEERYKDNTLELQNGQLIYSLRVFACRSQDDHLIGKLGMKNIVFHPSA